MKPALLVIVAVAFGATIGAYCTSPTSAQGVAAAQPWQSGQCYRVIPANRDTIYTFKVLEQPSGTWVRVQSVPTSPESPGGKPQVTQWLNSGSVFVAQEWSCP